MIRTLCCIAFSLFSLMSFAQQPTREELEKQRNDLKKEIEETQKALSDNKSQTKVGLVQWQAINKKVNLQDRVVENLNKDLRMLDNNMYTIQKDINRYDRLLDTLRQEYAKSMVYAYKNRSNYDFLNFIFAADNFNDAIKRVSYLKSYRAYREMQGQNILRTQDLRKQRIEDLGGVKVKKSSTLQVQSKEMAELENQKKDKDRILAELQKQGKQLSAQMAAKQRQMKKVSASIAAAIKRAQEEARKASLARAAEEDRKRKELEKANAKNNPTATNPTTSTTGATKSVKTTTKAPVARPVMEDLNSGAYVGLNANFKVNQGKLPWPVDNAAIVMHFGRNKLPGTNNDVVVTCISLATPVGSSVKAVADGEVSAVFLNEEQPFVIIQHGKYFTTYTNLNGISVSKGQSVKAGQVIGKVATNYDGEGGIDFYLNDDKNPIDPERWLRHR